MDDRFILSKWDPSKAYEKIDTIIAAVNENRLFAPTKEFPSGQFEKFDIMKGYNQARFMKGFRYSFSHNPCFLLFAHLQSVSADSEYYLSNLGPVPGKTGSRMHSSDDDLELFGALKLQKDYGDVLIRPVTLEDKITAFIRHERIRFPGHPEFDKKYYAQAKDPEKFQKAISDDFIQNIESLEKAFLKIHNRSLLVCFKRNADTKAAIELALFLGDVAEYE